jgi:hypothetical protein
MIPFLPALELQCVCAASFSGSAVSLLRDRNGDDHGGSKGPDFRW